MHPEVEKSLLVFRQARSIPQVVASSVTRFKNRPLFLDPSSAPPTVAATYGEMWRAVRAVASDLLQLGVQKGDRVALLANSSPEWVVADLAIQLAGAATVPLYPTLSTEQINLILDQSDSRIMFVGRAIPAGRFPQHIRILPMKGLLGRVLAADPAEFPRLERGDLCTIVYTSGTTGVPKGVRLTHGNFLATCEAGSRVFEVTPDDIEFSFLPLSHVFERLNCFCLLAAGGAVAYSRSLRAIPQELRNTRPTMLPGVPRFFEKMRGEILNRVAAAPKWLAPLTALLRWLFAGRPLPGFLRERLSRPIRRALGGNVRVAYCGGAPLSGQTWSFFKNIGVPLHEGYGMTETAGLVSVCPPGGARRGRVGPPIYGVEARIGEGEELQVRGAGIMGGYDDNPEATRVVFTADGWFRTGDMARIDDEGYIQIIGRLKEMFVLSTGKKVCPEPVEQVLAQDPLVEQCVLVGDGRKFIAVLICPVSGAARAEVERAVLRRAQSLADFEQPKAVGFLDRPLSIDAGELTPTLKVRRKIVNEKYAALIEKLYEEPK